jgi:hypothetical protein
MNYSYRRHVVLDANNNLLRDNYDGHSGTYLSFNLFLALLLTFIANVAVAKQRETVLSASKAN